MSDTIQSIRLTEVKESSKVPAFVELTFQRQTKLLKEYIKDSFS